MQTCSIDGCEAKTHARGWCRTHYRREQAAGTFTPTPRAELPPQCSLPGCDRKRHCRGWCYLHYGRWKKWGDVKEFVPHRDDISESDRFDQYVDKAGDDECWPWTGSKLGVGYGKFMLQSQRRIGAHRYSYEREFGPIPDGLHIDHLCRNRICVNPSHLEAVTQRENTLRGVAPAAINARKTHCVSGHEFTKGNTRLEVYGSGVHRKCIACQRENRRLRTLRDKARKQEMAGAL